MTKKTKTISLQGKDYAQVKDRIKEFRTDCPYGLIETTPIMQEDGQVMFRARILKDKSDPNSAEATGHAIGQNKGVKAFEKLETIAVGRALGLLGYGSDGEIATGEEMEEYLEFQENKLRERIVEAEEKFNSAKTQEELKEVWVKLDGELRAVKQVETLKDKRKQELTNENSKVSNKRGVVARQEGQNNGE